MNFLVKTFIKKDLKSIDAMEILKDTKMPIVIFHGGLDFFCNVKISQKIKEMNLSNVSVYIYPDSNHCCSYGKLICFSSYMMLSREKRITEDMVDYKEYFDQF